jgi:6-phosphogluconate dehydrogenase
MVPAGDITEQVVHDIADQLESGDVIIDGGNSYYRDDMRRSQEFAEKGIDYIDCGTSGGVFGLERGFCLMIGGPDGAVERLDPIFKTLAPGVKTAERTPGAAATRAGRERLSALRAERRRPLREDGPQRDRVWRWPPTPRANILARTPTPAGQARDGCRDSAARAPGVLPVRSRHPEVAEVARGSVISSWLLI